MRKRYLVWITVALVTVGALIWVRAFVFEKVAAKLKNRIESLNISGFTMRYDSIRVDWRHSAIELDNVTLGKIDYDTACLYPESITIAAIRAEGISLTQLILRKRLSLDALYLHQPRVVIRQNSMLVADSTKQRTGDFRIRIDHVYVRSADIMYTDSAACHTIAGIKGHLSVTDLNADMQGDRPLRDIVSGFVVDSAEITLPREFYTFRMLRAEWNAEKKTVRADSIKVIPGFGKLTFGGKLGYEVDRFDGIIPSFTATDVSFTNSDSFNLRVGIAEIRFHVELFRDRRLPFIVKEKPLPIAWLQSLPFGLRIDSVKITNSFVQYEEFAEGTAKPAGIFFDKLNATIGNVSSDGDSGNTTLDARARLFGRGELALFVTFPAETTKHSTAKGWIRNFPLPRLNPILTPSTQLHIESGIMKELLFDFRFNSLRSDGEVKLNYQGLKLVTFKEDTDASNEPQKDNFKTFMMNTFVFRTDMTDDLPEDKRKGSIDFVRDQSKSIFNYWSKSLISGIKSTYNLDNTGANDRNSKKDERTSQKEEKRLDRLAKKRQPN